MPQYMLLIYNPLTGPATPEQMAEMGARFDAYTQSLTDAGVLVGGDALESADVATTVRERDGQIQFTDGPFAETKEQLGGYYLLECKDLDEAIEWASKIPGAKNGSIEVRPIMEFNEDGSPVSGSEATANA